MRVKVSILLILVCFTAKGSMTDQNSTRAVLTYSYFAGVIIWPLMDYYWHIPQKNQKGLYLSQGFDLKMAVNGQIDSRSKLYFNTGKFEPGIIFEIFPEMDYAGLSISVDYLWINRKVSLLSGVEGTNIWNDNGSGVHTFLSYGINIEIRYQIKNRLSLSYIANIKSRPDLSENKPDHLYSGYLQLNFRLTDN